MWYHRKLENSCIGFFQARKLLQQNDFCQKILHLKICYKIENYHLLKISRLLTKNLKESYHHISADSFIKGTVIQIEKALINDCLSVLKVSWKFRIPIFIILQ